MNPIFLEIGPFTLTWYGIFAAVGFLAAMYMLMRNRGHAELESDDVYDLGYWILIPAIIGARLFYVIQFHEQFAARPLEIIRIDKGGIVFYGGLIAALISTYIFCRRRKKSFPSVLDAIAPALALGHAFGRVGCFINGCCFGRPCGDLPGVVYPRGSAPCEFYPGMRIHPVQLYESGCNLLLAIILHILIRRMKSGKTASLYMISYGVIRFFLEFLRGDHRDYIGPFTPAQVISLFAIALGTGLFIYFSKRDSGDGKEKQQA